MAAAAVNWICLVVLAFVFINENVCIKVDTNLTNGNYTTINVNSHQQTLQQQLEQHKSSNSNNEPDNITLLGDSELSASERTRRLIPYMAFYVPVAELPINKQYANIQTPKQQIATRPSAAATGSTGPSASSHIPLPQQYVHLKVTATGTGHSSSGGGGDSYLPPATVGHYPPSAGDVYHSLTYGGHHQQHPQQQHQQQSQFHILPTTSNIKQIDGSGSSGGNNKYPGHAHHVLPSGPPGPSASSAALSSAVGKGNSNNAFVTYKDINPIRHKTVQYFPPLSSTSSTSSVAASSSAYETIRHQQQQQQQQQHLHGLSGGVYRPRTKQSKINLTPFTPSNTVPGNFVPIVYTPVNNNNPSNSNNNINNYQSNNNIITKATQQTAGVANDDTAIILNEDEKQYHKQQQQIAIEYSSGPLPPPPSSAIDVQQTSSLLPPHRYNPNHHHHQQQHHHTPSHHNPKQQSQQYFSVTTSPLKAANVDLTHEEGASGNAAVNAQHHHHHHHPQQHNAQTIGSSPATIYQQQQHHHHQQPEHVIIDASVQQPQTLTLIGSKQQQHQQQYRSKPLQFQPPKPESFFESVQQHQHEQQHQHHNIEQVLKDVNSYDTKNSHTMTPQEKYVMYLQHQLRYNKQQHQQQHQHDIQQQQQHHHTTRQKYREPNNKEREQQYVKQQQQQQQHQQHNAQIFVLSSTASPHHDTVAVTALSPIRPSQHSHYSPNYPQHSSSPARHALFSRPDSPQSSSSSSSSLHSQQQSMGEQILTIPVHSLFGELDTLQHNHYSQSHKVHSSQYPKKFGYSSPSTPQYIDYLIDEPKQSLDDEQNVPQHQQQHHHQQHHQLETLKPTLGPPSHAFILVSTGAPFVHDANTQENYGSTLRPPYKNKPKIRLQPVLKEKNVNYASTEKPQQQQVVVSITPAPNAIIKNDDDSHDDDDDEDTKTKYVYVKQEFGQKLTGAVKLKPSNKYESDNQITHRQQHQQHNTPLQALAPRPATSTNSDKGQHYQQHQSTAEVELEPVQQPLPPKSILADPNELPDIRTSSLAEILHKLQESNHLPHTLTPDNIDNSIKTLIRILNNLKQTQTIVANPPQHHEATPPHASSPDYDYTTGSEEQQQQHQPEQHRPLEHPSSNDLSLLSPPPVNGPNKHPGPSTGRPGIDYPNYAEIPQTSFDCSQQRYKGFFGDPETNCQVWHYCDLNGGKASFLCPNGTIFSQIALTCDWWFNVKCGTTTQLYVLNERLYKYILPFTPKFPEDYSGPLVDKYLAMKFQEMEEKMRLEKEKVLQEEAEAATEPLEQHSETTSEDSKEDNHLEETTTEDTNSNNRHLKSPPPAPSNPMIQKHESVNSQVSEQSSERNLLIDDEVDDISQRGTIDTFDSTTIATMTATVQPERVSFNLKPIIVSSTIGPDYDDEQLQQQQQHHHQEDKRRHEKQVDNLQIQKTDDDNIQQNVKEETVNTLSGNKMQITVEKVNVIEIKPDGATGHLIRDMLLNTNNKK